MKNSNQSEPASVAGQPLLRIISISDIHLGHHNTTSGEIISKLYKAFPNSVEMADVDAIAIVGDLFDRAIGFHDMQAVEIKRWMRSFLKMCKQRGIVVLLLEGTPSHDWRQNRWMVEANDGVDAELHYVDTLCVRYIDSLGVHVLFVPDEWQAGDTDATWKDAVQALADAGVEQVDFTLLHGSFDYQLPAAAINAPRHLPERYLSITRKYVFTGHIHQSSVHDRILANGSFDRLCHGDESPKGFWDVTVREHGDLIVFVENREAKIYKTFDCRGYTIDDALAKLQPVHTLPTDSYVRIEANRGDPILGGIDVVKRTFPHVVWTVKVEKTADVQKNLLKDMRSSFTQTHLTSDNLAPLLMARIRELTSDPDVLACAETLLPEVL